MDNNSELLAALDTIAQRKPKVLVWGDVCRDVHYDVEERWNAEGPASRWRAVGCDEQFGMAGLVYLQARRLSPDGGVELLMPRRGSPEEYARRVPVVKRRLWRDGHNFLTLDERDDSLSAKDLLTMRAWLAEELREKPDAVAIVDYGHGACTPDAVRYVIDAAASIGCPVIVEPHDQPDWGRYAGATVIKCNARQYRAGVDRGDLWQQGFVVTNGAAGISVGAVKFPAHTPRSALRTPHSPDATGCGDIVTAVLTCCLGARIDLATGCRLANVVAGLKLAKRGAVPVAVEEVRKELTTETRRHGEENKVG